MADAAHRRPPLADEPNETGSRRLRPRSNHVHAVKEGGARGEPGVPPVKRSAAATSAAASEPGRLLGGVEEAHRAGAEQAAEVTMDGEHEDDRLCPERTEPYAHMFTELSQGCRSLQALLDRRVERLYELAALGEERRDAG